MGVCVCEVDGLVGIGVGVGEIGGLVGVGSPKSYQRYLFTLSKFLLVRDKNKWLGIRTFYFQLKQQGGIKQMFLLVFTSHTHTHTHTLTRNQGVLLECLNLMYVCIYGKRSLTRASMLVMLVKVTIY